MTKPFNFLEWGIDRLLIKNIIVGIIVGLAGTCVFLLYRLDDANQRACKERRNGKVLRPGNAKDLP